MCVYYIDQELEQKGSNKKGPNPPHVSLSMIRQGNSMPRVSFQMDTVL